MQTRLHQSGRKADFAQIWLAMCGVGSTCLGLGVLFLYFATRHGPHALSPVKAGVGIPFLVLFGIATLLLYRWGAVVLSIGFAAAAADLIIGAISQVPFPWIFLAIAFSLALLSPLLATVFAWRVLR